MNRITNEQREAIVRKAIAERDSLLIGEAAHPPGFDAWWEAFFALAGKQKAWPVKEHARAAFAALATDSEKPAGEPLTEGYVQIVPDKCDRIVWRNAYYHLPLAAAPTPDSKDAPEAGKPVAWMQTSKRGLIRGTYSTEPSAEHRAIAEIDGDTITPLYLRPSAADGAQESQGDPLQGAVTWLMEAAPGLNGEHIAGRLMIGFNRASRLRDAALSASRGGA